MSEIRQSSRVTDRQAALAVGDRHRRATCNARMEERLDRGEAMPGYLKRACRVLPVPPGRRRGFSTGSFGPTTAGRMDGYVEQFQSHGGSLIMIAKGNRSQA